MMEYDEITRGAPLGAESGVQQHPVVHGLRPGNAAGNPGREGS